MPRNKPLRVEVQTTLRIDPDLHLWLKHYALDHKTTYIGIVQDVLLEWAEKHGFKPPKDVASNTSSNSQDGSG
jgi:hypothetical protein